MLKMSVVLEELFYGRVFLQGFIRFNKEGGAQRVIDALKEANDGKVLIRDVETTLRVLEGTLQQYNGFHIPSRPSLLARKPAHEKLGS